MKMHFSLVEHLVLVNLVTHYQRCSECNVEYARNSYAINPSYTFGTQFPKVCLFVIEGLTELSSMVFFF